MGWATARGIGRRSSSVDSSSGLATAVLIRHAIGRRTFAQLTHTAFQHGVLVMIFASGIVSLALGLSALP